jgi:hypothetical protein
LAGLGAADDLSKENWLTGTGALACAFRIPAEGFAVADFAADLVGAATVFFAADRVGAIVFFS